MSDPSVAPARLRATIDCVLADRIVPAIHDLATEAAGRGPRVADVALMHLRLGQPLAEIAGRYDVPLTALHAAMAFYYDHKAEVDQSIEDEASFAEAFRRNNPSPLQEKLRALGSRSVGEIIRSLILIYEVLTPEEMRSRVEFL